MMPNQRIDLQQVDPASYQAVLAMEKYVQTSGLERGLIHLVKVRASQLNSCAFCLDMHNREAIDDGEDNRRLFVLAGWREAPSLYSERERAALCLTESVTLISQGPVTDEVWDVARSSFNEAELVQLLMAIATINVWNRLAVSTHMPLPDLR